MTNHLTPWVVTGFVVISSSVNYHHDNFRASKDDKIGILAIAELLHISNVSEINHNHFMFL